MNNNLHLIKDVATINKIMPTAQDKLVVLMFYTKNSPQSRTARQCFEHSAQSHMLSVFCIIDIDHYDGKVENAPPHIDFYFSGNKIGFSACESQKHIEDSVRAGEQYVMKQMTLKNQQQQQLNSQPQQQPLINSQQQPLISSPQPMYNPSPPNQGYVQPVYQQPPPVQQPIQQQLFQQMVQQQVQQSTDPNDLPSLHHMALMFNVYQKLHQLGLLNMNQQISQSDGSKVEGEEILPSGDKIVPLGDGKYGLIKKRN